jgi:exodeoxyribonuclease VII large subunit
MINLKQALYAWRDNEARSKGVETFRVLTNTALDEIVRALPRNKEELVAIKGIKDAKWNAYGKQIVALVEQFAPQIGGKSTEVESDDPFEAPASQAPNLLDAIPVGMYLDAVNSALYKLQARVRGEVTSFQERGSAIYFSIKDPSDESILSVFMWISDYRLAGVELAEGLEVIVEGRSEVYKPSGRMSFRAQTVEYVGEGALKRAYDALKKKLDMEGVFLESRKKPAPDYPERIGLITSRQGAVIHDFLNNLGRFGYQIRFVDSRVEGVAAVKDLLAAIRYFKTQDIDVLVMIRGGGSLESLQAFNNESVVRAISEFPVPTFVAIGHDKDVPLVCLAADKAPSTPTAVTVLLNRTWQDARKDVRFASMQLLGQYDALFRGADQELRAARERLLDYVAEVRREIVLLDRAFAGRVAKLNGCIEAAKQALSVELRRLTTSYAEALRRTTTLLRESERRLIAYNPMRQLRLGYSLLSANGRILRSIDDIKPGEVFEARLADGRISAEAKDINKNTKK